MAQQDSGHRWHVACDGELTVTRDDRQYLAQAHMRSCRLYTYQQRMDADLGAECGVSYATSQHPQPFAGVHGSCLVRVALASEGLALLL